MTARDSTHGAKTPDFPPGPKGARLLKLLFAHWRNPLGLWLQLAKEYGDTVYFRLGTKRVFFLKHPETIREVLVTHQTSFAKGISYDFADRFWGNGLVTSEGELHDKRHQQMQPAFHRERLAEYSPVMTDTTERMVAQWQTGSILDISTEMRRLTLEIIGKTLFSIDFEREGRRLEKCVTPIIALLEFSHLYALPLAAWIPSLPFPAAVHFRKALRELDRIIFGLIDERRKNARDTRDLFSMLIDRRITRVAVRDEIVTMLFAGHETTGRTLTWIWHLLSQHPVAEERLHREVARVLENRLPTFATLSDLTYTEAIINESLRLYPPVFAVGRRALKDQYIRGLLLPAGSSVVISPYVTHRDSRFFSKPLEFVPERWLSGAPATGRPKFAYFPFGGGIRGCIGEQFARLEMLLLVTAIAQKYYLRSIPGRKVEPLGRFALRPKYNIRLRVERRSSKPPE